MKIFFGVYLAMILLLSLSLVSCDKKDGVKFDSVQQIESEGINTPLTESQENGQEIESELGKSAYNVSFISVQQSGKGAFENSFTTSPENGKTLNVYVENNDRSGTVIFQVLKGTQDFGFIDVSAGKDASRTFSMTDGSGLSGDWKVYVTTRDGHFFDINVTAGQY
ncbi:hypothetical protein J2T12_005502 [Paenibacillus anaericanus]|uniref:hypothetical protein n=1 Tax=Paenibacillus anaericanus TaxID=170367 RepID=UPI0027856DDE|nr:hypothetical protein [Paenibacillus anaericanus]MDQ0092058.1 hypothetical protein [Paenibacillus anaericanus]